MSGLSIKECCGCGACYNVCPYDAIEMKYDDMGCIYPYIDKKKCKKCGVCLNVCNFKSEKNVIRNIMDVYAVVDKNEIRRLKSSSGGIFAALASCILKESGCVYGCAYLSQDSLEPCHIRITEEKDIGRIQGSKYVQSNLKKTYKQIKKDLSSGRYVLFSGTPCQIDGLYGFLQNKEYDNLLTVDVICHGVPGTKFFQDYIDYMENKLHGKIINVNFRDKNVAPWNKLRGSIQIRNGQKEVKKVFSPILSSYYGMFLKGLIFRDSCYTCKYASSKRISDITIGDFWGIERNESDWINNKRIDLNKGVSCMLINSGKGRFYFEKIKKHVEVKKTNFEIVSAGNRQLLAPMTYPEERDEIMKCYIKEGYEGIECMYKKKLGIQYLFFALLEILKYERF